VTLFAEVSLVKCLSQLTWTVNGNIFRVFSHLTQYGIYRLPGRR